ncbi:septum formation initiator family protein [Microbacterium sp. B35-30]|uniref:FtsB family cell division protein n=1 Tax=Microbacterium sp. B35-30 TaxID=1962642 RepID=UPI001EF8EAD5|nr:septum formation initiator family protein [Microbacterium sp. B35-30]
MAKTTAPPSRTPRATSSAAAARRRPVSGRRPVDVRGWLGGIRLSGFMVIMMGLVVLAAFVLVPTIGTYVDQRQQVAALEAAVQLSRDEVADLESQRERWQDPAYITTQARERLYYVQPGEVVYLVDDDLPPELEPQEQEPVSDELQAADADWMAKLMRSVTEAGLAQTVAPVTVGVPDPEPSPTPTP